VSLPVPRRNGSDRTRPDRRCFERDDRARPRAVIAGILRMAFDDGRELRLGSSPVPKDRSGGPTRGSRLAASSERRGERGVSGIGTTALTYV